MLIVEFFTVLWQNDFLHPCGYALVGLAFELLLPFLVGKSRCVEGLTELAV